MNLIKELKYKKLADRDLMALCAQDESVAMKVIYERYLDRLYSYFLSVSQNRVVADELTQELFLKVYRSRTQYNNHFALSTWLYTIARNLFYDYLRKEQKYNLDDEFNEEIHSHEDELDIDEKIINIEEQVELQKRISQLPLAQREVLQLWSEENSITDIAHVMGKSEQAIKNLIHRAKLKISRMGEKEEL